MVAFSSETLANGTPNLANNDGFFQKAVLASQIAAATRESPNRFRNRSFAEQAEHNEAQERYRRMEAASRRLSQQRESIRRELCCIRLKYPCADDCELLQRLIENKASPAAIACQRTKVRRISQGLSAPTPKMQGTPVQSEKEVQCPTKSDTSIKCTAILAYGQQQSRSQTPGSRSCPTYGSADSTKLKELRARISRELREAKRCYPDATEAELVQKLQEMGAHPQTVACQRNRMRKLSESVASSRASSQKKKIPLRTEPEQPRRTLGKKNPLLIPIASRSQQQIEVSTPSSVPVKGKSSLPRAIKVSVPSSAPSRSRVSRASTMSQSKIPVPRTSTGIKQEICKTMRRESTRPQQSYSVRQVSTPSASPCVVTAASSQRPTSIPSVARKPVARRLFDSPGRSYTRVSSPRGLEQSLQIMPLSPIVEERRLRTPASSEAKRRLERSRCQKQEESSVTEQSCLGNLPSAYEPEVSYTEVQDMIDEEKKEIRCMHNIVSQLMEPARQVQFKDMYALVPHIFFDETETSPEVAAAILHSDEKGLSLKTTPAKLYDSLFQGGEADRTTMKVNAPSAHTKAGVLVPLSSEGVEASFVGYEPAGLYEVLALEDDQMPSPKKEDAGEIGTIRDNLGYSASSLSKGSQVSVSSEDGQFKIILQPDVPKETDFIQIRGSQPPPWFPGYYSMMGDNTTINVTSKPWTVLEKAWREVVPQKINTDTGKVIIGS